MILAFCSNRVGLWVGWKKNIMEGENHLSNYKNKKMACLFGPVTQSLWVLVFYSLSGERRSSSISLSILEPILIYFLIGALTQQHDFYTSFKMFLKGLECLLKNKSVIDRN